MTDQHPPPTDAPRPWWKRWWGISYLVLLGLTIVAVPVVASIPVIEIRMRSLKKAANLEPVALALDVLLAIPIGVWAFRTRRWHLHNAPIVDVFLGIILFLALTAALVIFVFCACMGASTLL